jgi:voltage-gated potassium channel
MQQLTHPADRPQRWRARLFGILHKPDPGNPAARIANYLLAALILANAASVALESMAGIGQRYRVFFGWFETASTALFIAEYAMRLWVCVEQRHRARPVLGRLRYALEPLPLLDLLVIVTYWTPIDLRFLRVARIVRLLPVLHLHEFERALSRLTRSLRSRRELLIVAVTLMVVCVYVSAGVLYEVEHAHQPAVFTSIPATFWWAVESFTTIGYGDMTPITGWGKFAAALICVFGIGIFALPSAIVTAAIIEASAAAEEPAVCEACGHRHGEPLVHRPPQRADSARQ